MIIYISKCDDILRVVVVDDTIIVATDEHGTELTLQELWTLKDFLIEFPDFPYVGSLESANYEPDRNLYHVVYASKRVMPLNRPEDDPVLNWFHNNRDAIVQAGVTLFQAKHGV